MYQLFSGKPVAILFNVLNLAEGRRQTAVFTPRAIKAAYQKFEQAHPEWADSLFDESFLCKEAAPLFANGSLPTSKQLATAWRNQFGIGSPAQKAADIRKMQPVAAIFLQMVQQELSC